MNEVNMESRDMAPMLCRAKLKGNLEKLLQITKDLQKMMKENPDLHLTPVISSLASASLHLDKRVQQRNKDCEGGACNTGAILTNVRARN